MRAKEQQQKLVKKAAGIAKDVMKFWSKARSVHNFTVQEKVEAIKRRKLDKELNDFVAQSEKCALVLYSARCHTCTLKQQGHAACTNAVDAQI